MRPESDRVIAPSSEAERQRGSPGTAAHNGNAAHAGAFRDAPKRCSVPCSRRWMLGQCFNATIQQQTKTIAPDAYPYFPGDSHRIRKGSTTAARIDASET